MKMSGEEVVPAPRGAVWKALNDPEVLRQCIPGCESLSKRSDTEFEALVVAKVGPVKARFKGNVKLTDLNPPENYRISGQGEGGIAGFAKGGASIKLSEQGPAQTLLSYDVDAQIGGKLAMIGSRLIDSTARSMAQQFFDKFAAIVVREAAVAVPAAEAPVVRAPARKRPAKKVAKRAVKKVAKKTSKKAAKKPAKKK